MRGSAELLASYAVKRAKNRGLRLLKSFNDLKAVPMKVPEVPVQYKSGWNVERPGTSPIKPMRETPAGVTEPVPKSEAAVAQRGIERRGAATETTQRQLGQLGGEVEAMKTAEDLTSVLTGGQLAGLSKELNTELRQLQQIQGLKAGEVNKYVLESLKAEQLREIIAAMSKNVGIVQ